MRSKSPKQAQNGNTFAGSPRRCLLSAGCVIPVGGHANRHGAPGATRNTEGNCRFVPVRATPRCRPLSVRFGNERASQACARTRGTPRRASIPETPAGCAS